MTIRTLVAAGLVAAGLVAAGLALASPAAATNGDAYACPPGTEHDYKLDNLDGPTFTVPTPPAGWTVTSVVIKAGRDHHTYAPVAPGEVLTVKSDVGHDVSHAHVCKARKTPPPSTTSTTTSTTTTTTTTEPPPTSSSTTTSTTTTTAPASSTSSTTTTTPPPPSTNPPPTSSSSTTTTVTPPVTPSTAPTPPPTRQLPATGNGPDITRIALLALALGVGLTYIARRRPA